MLASTSVVEVKVSILAYSGLMWNIGARYSEAKLESGRWKVGVLDRINVPGLGRSVSLQGVPWSLTLLVGLVL